MGGGKLLQPFRGRPLLFHALESARACCNRVIIVTGYEAQRVGAAATTPEAPGKRGGSTLIVDNPNYRLGMFSSIQRGAQAVRSPWFFVLPADLPLVKPAAFEAVAAELHRLGAATPEDVTAPDAIVPIVSGTRGHPVLIRSAIIPALVAATPEAGPMRRFLSTYRIHRFDHDDRGMISDVDTHEALDELHRHTSD